MKYRIEIVINEDSAQNVVLYYGEEDEGTMFVVVKQLAKQGYVLKIMAEIED